LDPALLNSAASGIAEDGSIVGAIFSPDESKVLAVRWTPVPEAGSNALIASALAVASLLRTRRCS
jgi:hypothetical protein